MQDFTVHKFAFFSGPNYYLDRKAMVFNLFLDPAAPRLEYYLEQIRRPFPQLALEPGDKVADLFVRTLLLVLKMDIDLYINAYDISRDGDEYVIAVEYHTKEVAEDAAHLVSQWFQALNDQKPFDFQAAFLQLQEDYDRTVYGGPTIYALVEKALKAGIPVNYLYEENQFQWGYGKKQVRGRSTTLHTDSIKDTEFTTYKDMVKDFLLMCGFPTPAGSCFFTVDGAVEEAQRLGFPVVVKPVSGHKGEGVSTGLRTGGAVARAFGQLQSAAADEGVHFEGALVEKEVVGTDHRLLVVGGKFAAAVQRVAAYVVGDGQKRIRDLIEMENATEARRDNARSPLAKIYADDDLIDFITNQGLSLDSVPDKGETVTLRRVANLSAGGVSIDVTRKVHPENVRMAENIARFFDLCCLGIDVISADIGESWQTGRLGIIEINAGPGIFMHVRPAQGESIDVPGKILQTHFPWPEAARIPIITGNCLTTDICQRLYESCFELSPQIEVGALTPEGLFFNGSFMVHHHAHDLNVKILLRNQKLDLAIVNHSQDDILDYGTYHQGADLVILKAPRFAEKILARDLLPGGYLIQITPQEIGLWQNGQALDTHPLPGATPMEEIIAAMVKSLLPELVEKYC